MNVQLRLGSNGFVKVWLNGKEVWNWNSPSGRLVKLDEDIVKVTIPKGGVRQNPLFPNQSRVVVVMIFECCASKIPPTTFDLHDS